MAPMAASHRSVEFDVQPAGAYAVQLRLTPALLDALQRAEEAGHGCSIRFGAGPQGNAISVAGSDFRFTALAEQSCDLLHLPADGGAALVGAVRQKLMVARTLEDERVRVRARGEEAERRGHERKAQLLDGKPVAKAGAAGGAGKKVAATSIQRRVTPPPRGPTPPPPQLTASMLAAPAGRPPTHPTTAAPPPPAAPPAPPAKPMHKSASTGKLGLTSKSSSAASLGAGSLQLAASPRVLQAARTGVGLRLMLIAILAERPMSLNAVKAVLADAASRVKAFKMPKKEELERTIKAVAEFRAPGLYILYNILLKELEAMPAAAPAAPANVRGRSSTPPEQHGPSPSGQSGDAAAGAGAGAAGGAARNSGGKQKKAAAAAAATAAAPDPAAAGTATAAGTAGRKPVGSKRGRYDWTDDDSDGERQPPAAQRPRPHSQQQQQQPPSQPPPQQQPVAAAQARHDKACSEPASGVPNGLATSPPSVGGAPTAGGGSSSSGGLAGAAAGGGARVARRTSSSRGSEHADESWIEEHADRQPEPAAPISSTEEYRAREAAFTAKYETYFALHQLIEAHKKDFEALDAAIRAAGSEAERERHRSELERLHRKRGERAKRWDQAYRVLHQELSAAKARMAEFVQRLQQQQAQLQPRRSGTPETLPAVRVK